jgi:multidrug transporter EmrE-like cation transporter
MLQFVFVFGMPWLDNGLWPQTEGPSAAIHLLSALLALFVGLQVAFKDAKYLKALSSPVVGSLFTFAIFSAFLAPFTPEPIRSVQGTMKHGVGILWQFEMALAVAAASALWQTAIYRRIALCASAAAATLIVFLYAVPDRALGVPLAFPEWVGIVGLAVAGMLLTGSRVSPIKIAVAVVICAGGYVVSENRAVLLAVGAVVLYHAAGNVPYFRSLVRIPALRAATVVLIAIGLTTAVYVAGPLIESRAVARIGPDEFPTVVSSIPIDKAHVQDGLLGSIWSRSYMVRILVDDLIDNPSKALVGNGFGSFATAYEHHARDVPGRFFPVATPTASTTFWDVHTSANFHSHNMLAETVASVGVSGAVLWLGVFAAMAWSSAGGAAVALGMIVVGSFWFPINHMLGVLAFLTATTVTPRDYTKKSETLLSGAGPLVAILGAALLGYVGIATCILGIIERSERGFPAVEVNTNLDTCGFIRTHFFPEQEIVIDLYSVLKGRVANATDPAHELFDRSTNVISINCMLRRYYEREDSIRALTASLSNRSALIALGPASFGALQPEIVKWGEDIDRLLAALPERTEFLPPYIAILGARAPDKAIAEIDRYVPRLKDTDPVKHYLLSQRSRRTGDEDGYRVHFARALELGFANLWKVSEAEANKVRAHR